MKSNQSGFILFESILLLLILVTVFLIGIYIYRSSNSSGIISYKSGAEIEIISGAGGMPPDNRSGKILDGEEFTVVFTDPFPSLENWQASKVIKKVTTTSGKASIDLAAGKYGVYYIYNGQKTLYSDLTLENPKNDIQRDKQGSWYVKIGTLQRIRLNFSVNSLPV